MQHIADRVWDRFVKEYLPSQMNRKKRRINQRNLQAGDVVLVADPNLSRPRWRLGRVNSVFPGADGRVRAVEVRTAQGLFTRPITRLCLLEPVVDDSAKSDLLTEEEEDVPTEKNSF